VPDNPTQDDLIALKEQFDDLRRRESNVIENIFDVEIRRRFGLMICRAIYAAHKAH
jgi:hypothetical protein